MARHSLFRLYNWVRRGRGVASLLSCSPPTSLSLPAHSSSFHIIPYPNYAYSPLPPNLPRPFSSSSSSSQSPSNILLIQTEDELNKAYSKVKDDSLPAIFYFTAAWCGPCRLIAPVINNWSQEFPHVTIFKIDIDEAGLQGALGKLGITAVVNALNFPASYFNHEPTLHFFHNGKKESEVVGADIGSMNATVQRLFK